MSDDSDRSKEETAERAWGEKEKAEKSQFLNMLYEVEEAKLDAREVESVARKSFEAQGMSSEAASVWAARIRMIVEIDENPLPSPTPSPTPLIVLMEPEYFEIERD